LMNLCCFLAPFKGSTYLTKGTQFDGIGGDYTAASDLEAQFLGSYPRYRASTIWGQNANAVSSHG
jgi:hypothetical protein